MKIEDKGPSKQSGDRGQDAHNIYEDQWAIDISNIQGTPANYPESKPATPVGKWYQTGSNKWWTRSWGENEPQRQRRNENEWAGETPPPIKPGAGILWQPHRPQDPHPDPWWWSCRATPQSEEQHPNRGPTHDESTRGPQDTRQVHGVWAACGQPRDRATEKSVCLKGHRDHQPIPLLGQWSKETEQQVSCQPRDRCPELASSKPNSYQLFIRNTPKV